MIESGSAQKYALYAIGEIALVVIGILIALQINNWNEDKKKVKTIKVYLENLVDDIRTDMAKFSKSEKQSMFRYYSGQYLLQLANELPYDPIPDGHIVEEWTHNSIWQDNIPVDYNREFVAKAFLWTHRTVGQDDKVSSLAIVELKNTPEYSFLDNNKLKDAISDYYADWNFRFGPYAQTYINELVSDWQNALREEGIINSNPFTNANPIRLLQANPYLVGTLRGLTAEASWQAMSCKIIIDKGSQLSDLIESEINKM